MKFNMILLMWLVLGITGTANAGFKDSTIATGSDTAIWSTAGTWTHGVVPGINDTAIIRKATTMAGSTSIGKCFVNTLTGGLIVRWTFAVNDSLIIGGGASMDGKLIFDTNSVINLGTTGKIAVNNAQIYSSATANKWAYITGSGGIFVGPYTSGPKQDWFCSYVSFQNTGDLNFGGGPTGGSITPRIKLTHDIFIGNGIINIGKAGWTAGTVNITTDSCDFRNVGIIRLGGLDPTTGLRRFNHNTDSNTTANGISIQSARYTISNNTFYNCDINATQAGSAGQSYCYNNFFGGSSTKSSASCCIVPIAVSTIPQDTLVNNYFYTPWPNAHVINSTGTAGSGTLLNKNNIFEAYYNSDGSNQFISNPRPQICLNNILIGAGSLISLNGQTMQWDVKNNTVLQRDSVGGNGGCLFLCENITSTGTVNLIDNLSAGQKYIYHGVDCITPGFVQPLGRVGYNGWWHYQTIYSNVGGSSSAITIATNDTLHDVKADPIYRDSSKAGLDKWDLYEGSGIGTFGSATSYLLNINGYSNITKTQSLTPSSKSVIDLNRYQREKLKPTNKAYKGAASDGGDIGAVPFAITHIDTITGSDTLKSIDSLSANFSFGLYPDSAKIVLLIGQTKPPTTRIDSTGLVIAGTKDTLKFKRSSLAAGKWYFATAITGSAQTGFYHDTTTMDSVTINNAHLDTLIAIAGTGGTVSPTQIIDSSTHAFSVTATPNTGKSFVNWTCRHGNVVFTDSTVAAGVWTVNNSDTVDAHFKTTGYVNLTMAGVRATVTPGTTAVPTGTPFAITATAAAPWDSAATIIWSVSGGASVSSTSSSPTTATLTTDGTITATFYLRNPRIPTFVKPQQGDTLK